MKNLLSTHNYIWDSRQLILVIDPMLYVLGDEVVYIPQNFESFFTQKFLPYSHLFVKSTHLLWEKFIVDRNIETFGMHEYFSQK